MSDYVESVQSEALRIRWISVQCYEMVLPNGKTIVTDPFYWEGDNRTHEAAGELPQGLRPDGFFRR